MDEFLTNYGLYQEYSTNSNLLSNPYNYIGKTFDYKCEKEDSTKTFQLKLDSQIEKYFGSLTGCVIPDELIKENKIDFTLKVIGECQSCKNYQIYFLLHVYSTDEIIIKKEFYEPSKTSPKIYIKKVGANPQIKIIPDKIVSKYFERETNNWYFKAINSLNDNYGIGSFAYFRRIIEKELINIIKDIQELPDSNSTEIKKLLDKHNENPHISTIYENIFKYLPSSLKSLDDNPFKLLYKQTSEGLHSLTEEQCLKKAKNILLLLTFVIRKINEEKSHIQDLREVIKELKLT